MDMDMDIDMFGDTCLRVRRRRVRDTGLGDVKHETRVVWLRAGGGQAALVNRFPACRVLLWMLLAANG